MQLDITDITFDKRSGSMQKYINFKLDNKPYYATIWYVEKTRKWRITGIIHDDRDGKQTKCRLCQGDFDDNHHFCTWFDEDKTEEFLEFLVNHPTFRIKALLVLH